MKHVLAIDQGTTGSTCLVVRADGAVVGRGYREIPQHFPQPGWVEHEPADLFDRTVEAAREAIAAANVIPDAVGITNQRETIVAWRRSTGEPIQRAIVWQDRRTAQRCRELEPMRERLAQITGLVPDPYFSATKAEWLLKRHPDVLADDLVLGTVDSWLIWKLTGGRVHATDPTNASRTMLFDIERREWSEELCGNFSVPRSSLPEVRPSSGQFGEVTAGLLCESAIPITGVAGDQQAALFGQGCWAAGDVKNTYGTGAFLLMNTGTARPRGGDGLLVTIACDPRGGPAYALEAAIFIAGAAVQWLRDGLGIITDASETEELARSLTSNEGVYFVPALTGLGAPSWEPEARGTIVGLTRGSGRAHLARAALEAMAFGTADVLDAMSSRSGAPIARLRVDGGATHNDWLMQFQSDVLGVPVERPDIVETTALGAAGLAGLAAGVWFSSDDFVRSRQFQIFEPGDAGPSRAAYDGWHRAMRAALSWARDR